MSPFAPVLRLARRPVVLLSWLWLTFIAAGVAGLFNVFDASAAVHTVSRVDQLSDAAWLGLWRATILVPAFSGLLAGLSCWRRSKATTRGRSRHCAGRCSRASSRARRRYRFRGIGRIVAGVALTAGVQGSFWLLLRRYLARGDLR